MLTGSGFRLLLTLSSAAMMLVLGGTAHAKWGVGCQDHATWGGYHTYHEVGCNWTPDYGCHSCWPNAYPCDDDTRCRYYRDYACQPPAPGTPLPHQVCDKVHLSDVGGSEFPYVEGCTNTCTAASGACLEECKNCNSHACQFCRTIRGRKPYPSLEYYYPADQYPNGADCSVCYWCTDRSVCPQCFDPTAGTETCNGLDDDWDGYVDEEMDPTTATEQCGNGKDDNCNGLIDEGCSCDSDLACCPATVGSPVNVTTGTSYTDEHVDIRVATPGVPLVFARRHMRQDTNYPLPPTGMTDRMVLGPGWSHTYDLTLRVKDSTHIIVSGGTRGDLMLTKDSTVYRAGTRPEIAVNASPYGSWRLLFGDGTEAVFEHTRGNPVDKLKLIWDNRSHQGVRVSRNTEGRVDKVQYYDDAPYSTGPGPYLKFWYLSSGMLDKVVLNNLGANPPAAATWLYGYSQFFPVGGSVPVSWSPILATVTNPAGSTRHYGYAVLDGGTGLGAELPRYVLAKVVDEDGSSSILRELHVADSTGKTVRTVSPEGDYSFHYASTTQTLVYSSPKYGGFCSSPGSCSGDGQCEGICTEPSDMTRSVAQGKPCSTDSQCHYFSPSASCSFDFGRCYKYCADDAACGSSGFYCAPNPNLPGGQVGRCYAKREIVNYDAATKRVTDTTGYGTCNGAEPRQAGIRHYEWNTTNGTLDWTSVDFGGGTVRYNDYAYDSKLRIVNTTTNNDTHEDTACNSNETEPCLRQQLTYESPSDPRFDKLVFQDYRSEAITGAGFGTRVNIFQYDMSARMTSVARDGKTRDLAGNNNYVAYGSYYSYSSAGRLASIDPPNTPAQSGLDNKILFTYYSSAEGAGRSGQLNTITRHVPGGLVTTHTTTFGTDYSDFGQPGSMTGPDGVQVQFTYDRDRLTSVTRGTAAPETTSYAYDALGRLTKVTLPGATQCVHYLYEPRGFGQVTHVIVSDSCTDQPTISSGDYIQLSYDGDRRLSGIAFYLSGSPGTLAYQQSVEYDPDTGRIKRRFDKGSAQGPYKRFLYDAFHRLTDMGDELCSSCAQFPDCPCPRVAYTHNGLGQVTQMVRQLESGSLTTVLQYDNAANLKSVATPATATSTATTTYVYDDFGRVVEVSSPDSGLTRYTYDGNDNVTARKTAIGTADEKTTTYSYDGANRLIEIKHGTFAEHCYAGGAIGQDVKLYYDNHATCTAQDMCHKGTTRLVLAEVEAGCDANDIPMWYRHWYDYDEQGRVIKEKYSWQLDAQTWSTPVSVAYQYTAGQLAQVTLPSGHSIIYTRDGSGPSDARKVTRIQFNDGSSSDVVTDIGYQPFGPVKAYTLAAHCSGTSTPITVTFERDTSYLAHDVSTTCSGLLGRAVQSDVPPRIGVVTDLSPRSCSSSADCLSGDYCEGDQCKSSLHDSYYSYDYASRLTCDATESTDCQESADSTRTVAAYSGENLAHLFYRNGFTSGGQALDFQYAPNSNRLTLATASSPERSIAYSSDGAGRRSYDTEDALPLAHKLAAKRYYYYHRSGRLSAFVGRTPVETGTGPYVKSYAAVHSFSQYDHRGLRIAKQLQTPDGDGNIFYFYDPDGNLLSEYQYSVGVDDPQVVEYINLEGTLVFQHTFGDWGSSDSYVVGDQLGRPAVAVAADGEVQWRPEADAFGWTTSAVGWPIIQQRLPGQYEDSETAVWIFDTTTYDNPNVPSDIYVLKPPLHYNWHRTYDPMVGRYLEPDPLGLAGGLNPYAYVGHDPVNRIDPTGEVPIALPWLVACAASGPCLGAVVTVLAGAADLIGDLIWPAASEPEVSSDPLFSKGGPRNIKPSWLEEAEKDDPDYRVKPGEKGGEYARRVCDRKFGKGNYSTWPNSDYSRIRKLIDYKGKQ